MGSRSFCAVLPSMPRRRIARAALTPTRMRRRCWAGRRNLVATMCGWRTIRTMKRCCARPIAWGLLVWSENPVYWALEFDNPKVLAKAEQQLDEEINTSRNHAAIILWSMANETPNTPARTQFIETLASRARGLDPTTTDYRCTAGSRAREHQDCGRPVGAGAGCDRHQ